MFLPIYYAIIIAVLFDVLIPVAFLLGGERRWGRFRSRLLELSSAPILAYADLVSEPVDPLVRRFFGQVEAIEGSDQLWVRGASCSAVIDFTGSPFYILEKQGSVDRLKWKSVHSLAEGTKLFVAGELRTRGGRPVFIGQPNAPLIAVSYDVEERELLPLLLRGGRMGARKAGRAAIASASIGLGVFTIVFLALSLSPILESVRFLAILIAFSAVLIFLPPGDLFLWLASNFWRRMRDDRIECEITRFLSGNAGREDGCGGTRSRAASRKDFMFAAISLAFAFLCNFTLAVVIYRLLAK